MLTAAAMAEKARDDQGKGEKQSVTMILSIYMRAFAERPRVPIPKLAFTEPI